ncbi:hypothetical protein KGD82_13490 [Nocardiopsis eucommiae]|uniref:Helix-turn-helix DNA binding domain protein n=1 Tax=Nocardiopsis eucommiae TaxID=2831970 RepID=A0A975LD22_9ACTN|nr:hypothetical protein KGD82_13490 [Nocardiopsis eucommiae]
MTVFHLLCRTCGSEMDSGTVCPPCVGALAADLRALWASGPLHGLDVDLDIAIAKQARFAPSGGGGRPVEAPLPLNLDASDVRADLHSTLATWCRIILTAHGGTTPADTIPAMARYLHRQTAIIRTSEWADEAVDELREAVRRTRRAIDRPVEMVFAGTCPTCEMPVYGMADRESARCRTTDCGGVVEDIDARREASVQAAKDAAPGRQLTVAEAAMAARALGRGITDRGIRKAVAEGRLAPVSEKPLKVRLGDVLDMTARKKQVA